MEKNIHTIIIGATIAIIIIGSLLVPIIVDYTDSTAIPYENHTSGGSFASVPSDESITIEITTTIDEGNTTISVNGESVDIYTGSRAIFIAEKLTICQNYVHGIYIYGINTDNIIKSAVADKVTVVVNGKNISVSWENSTTSESGEFNMICEWSFYRYNSGDWRILDHIGNSMTIYINNISQVYSSNWIGTTSEYFSLNGNGVTVYSGATDAVASTETLTASVNLTDLGNGVSSFIIDSDRTNSSAFKFTVDNNGESYDVYPYFFVFPAKVNGYTEQNAMVNAVLYMLPVILIAGIVAIVAHGAITRR